jgi:hypothetical protein
MQARLLILMGSGASFHKPSLGITQVPRKSHLPAGLLESVAPLASAGLFSLRLGVRDVAINGRTRSGNVTLVQVSGSDIRSSVDDFLRRAGHAYRFRDSEEPGPDDEPETEGHALRWRGVLEDTQDKDDELEVEGQIVNLRRPMIRE